MKLISSLMIFVLSFFPAAISRAADWPMWRFNAGRSAASPEDLPAELHLQWARQFPQRIQVWDDPLNHDLMPYDRVLEPIVMDGRVFIGLNDTDKVVALDAETGDELWSFYTDGPVRLPPAGWNGNVYFTSDDGYLYCVSAADGKLVWKFRGAPGSRKVLGNGRVISMWPARGGPVILDGTVYFAASIWPFLGTFIYAIDAESGAVRWVNDSTGSQYIKQPHSAPSFAGVAPQGALVATRDFLVVPGGRSVPAVFERATGKLVHFHLNEGGKGTGGSFVIAGDREFFVHTRMRGVRRFDLASGVKDALMLNEPVLDDDELFTATDSAVMAMDAQRQAKWQVPVDGSGDLIQAGTRLYAAGQKSITAIARPRDGEPPQVVWSESVEGQIQRLLAGAGKLLAVTLDGRILAFGSGAASAGAAPATGQASVPPPETLAEAESILARSGARAGYALAFGVDDSALLEAILAKSDLHLVAIDPDGVKIDALRRRLDGLGLYGRRVALHQGDPLSFQAPPFIANLTVVNQSLAAEYASGEFAKAIYASTRPYGGAVCFLVDPAGQPGVVASLQAANLSQARIESGGEDILLFRDGPLPGAAPWTHQYGNVANTAKSDDQIVKAPLGILWFGGNSNLDILPRHGHGPPQQVIGGRLFIQGINRLSARDVYTGRELWDRQFDDLGLYGIYYDDTYKETPLDPAYNQVHIPGANARGTNFVVTPDKIYLAKGSQCLMLDVATGETVGTVDLPRRADGEVGQWSYIGVYKDILLGGTDYANYTRRLEGVRYDASGKRGAAWSSDKFGSLGLAAFDRHSGRLLWVVEARHSFLNNGIVAGGGRVYCLDKLPKSVEEQLARRGQARPESYRMMALDARSGQVVWETSQNIFGTWLGYSESFDVLLQAGAAASDRSQEEVEQGIIAFRGADGGMIWQKMDLAYAGPCIIHNDTIITNSRSNAASSGAFHLVDGSPVMIPDPLTGKPRPWQYARAHGCNTAVASEHLLTFRSGAAGYYDLASKCGTGNLGGFRAGCSSNLIVADGVLNAPDYTRTCSCGYQNQTSLALIHMPELEMWAVSGHEAFASGDRLQRIGLNLGAPGDRQAADGTLWLEYPAASSASPPIDMEIQGDNVDYFRRHPLAVTDAELPWVAASGVRNVTQLRISLTAKGGTGATASEPSSDAYTVRLHFCEPDDLDAGQRVFDVAVQGKVELEGLDVVHESGGKLRGIVREIRHVRPEQGSITIALRPREGAAHGPILSGVQLIAE